MSETTKTTPDDFYAAFLEAQKSIQASFQKDMEGQYGKYVASEKVIPKVKVALNEVGLSLIFGQADHAMPVRYPSKPSKQAGSLETDGGGDTALVYCWAKAVGKGGEVCVGMWQDVFGSFGNTAMNRHMSANATITFANRKLAMMLMGATDGDTDVQGLYNSIAPGGDDASHAAANARAQYANGGSEEDGGETESKGVSLRHDDSTRKAYPYPAERIARGHALMVEFLGMGIGTATEKSLADFYVKSYGDTRGNQAPTEEMMKAIGAIVKKYDLKVKGD